MKIENCLTASEMIDNRGWEHDVTGEIYEYITTIIDPIPQHAGHWYDGIYGGHIVEIGDETFTTVDSVRGIGFKVVVAFDLEGFGVVFSKKG